MEASGMDSGWAGCNRRGSTGQIRRPIAGLIVARKPAEKRGWQFVKSALAAFGSAWIEIRGGALLSISLFQRHAFLPEADCDLHAHQIAREHVGRPRSMIFHRVQTWNNY
jgi:hypothetical protein